MVVIEILSDKRDKLENKKKKNLVVIFVKKDWRIRAMIFIIIIFFSLNNCKCDKKKKCEDAFLRDRAAFSLAEKLSCCE